VADNYDQYSHEELLRLLRERDRKPKFGLVWERDEIEHDKSLNEDFVALDLDPGLSCGDAPFENLIIEGDNFDALRYLRMTHAGRVKCIYIDPPYNTGNRDFIYNDRFVDKDDAYRHSKWLEFMYRRLILAKDLLAEDGVIFVSIDDNEGFHLGMLMEQIFSKRNFIGCFIWRKVDSPNNNNVNIAPNHEFVLCYALNKDNVELSQMHAPDIVGAYGQTDEHGRRFRDRLLKKNGSASLRADRPTMWFPIIDPDGNEVYPIHDNGEEAHWAMGIKGVSKHLSDGTLVWKRRKKLGKDVWEPYTREYAPESPTKPYPTIWSDLPTMRQAKAMLKDIFQTADLFSTPKPVELIERLLQMVNDKNALVLDFFAGSGTTAHSVMRLNAADGGNRKYILVSNTEATLDDPKKNLVRDVCAVRVRSAIDGYKEVPGLGGNFAYLRTKRIPISRVFNDIQHEQVWRALQLIHGVSLLGYIKDAQVQVASKNDDRLVYVPKLSEAVLVEVAKLAGMGGRLVVYSWQPGQIRQRVDAPNVAFEKIPEFLVSRFGGGK
jgi:adenine-specific DNA-methyltransferase